MEKAIAGYDEMKQMATNARKEAIERFDISVIAAQYENYLKEAIAK
jgi:glycosyltransferase involved in cell wall biosynthesis